MGKKCIMFLLLILNLLLLGCGEEDPIRPRGFIQANRTK